MSLERELAREQSLTDLEQALSAAASCVFVVADGRRFSCPERFAHAVQTASSVERSTACRVIAPVHLSAAVRRVTATIESAQACPTWHKVRAIGNAVQRPFADLPKKNPPIWRAFR